MCVESIKGLKRICFRFYIEIFGGFVNIFYLILVSDVGFV